MSDDRNNLKTVVRPVICSLLRLASASWEWETCKQSCSY